MDILKTLPSDTVVTAAFAELLDDVTNLLSAAQTQKPLDKEEIGFWKRQLNALNKAESHWLQGVRPQIGANAYLLASASRPGALIHRLIKQGGIVVCGCEAGQRGLLCWHHVLINVLERAAELAQLSKEAEEVSSGPENTPEVAQQLLSERLTATAAIVDAMRHAQGRAALRCDPPGDNPLGDDPGDTLPERRPLGVRLASARKRSAYFASAFYLEAA